MKRFLSRRHGVLMLMSIAALITVYLAVGERPAAQERPADPPKARFEQFSKSDGITADIRDRSREIVRVQFHSIADSENVAKYGRIVQDFGSSVILAKKKSTDMSRSGLDVQRIETTINLPGAKFEPVDAAPPETIRAGNGAGVERGYYVVQLGGIATDEWLDSIRDAGVEVLQYVPHQAFFVYGDGAAIAKVAGHSRVRWVGVYTAEQKLSPDVTEFARRVEGEKGSFDIAVFGRADLAEVAEKIGGRIISQSKLTSNFFNVLRVEIATSELARVAEISDVFRIDPYVRSIKEDERAAQVVAGNYSNTTTISAPGYNPLAQFGVDGTGVTVAVADDGISIPGNGGFYITAANTINGPLRGAAAGATGGHGHLNAGIIAGDAPFGVLDPTGYNYGKGIAPKANIINIPFLVSGNTTTDAQSIDDTLNTLGPNGVRGTISNNSWGSGTNGSSYDSLAAQYDGMVQDGSIGPTIDPFNIIFSAGNSGAGGLTRPKVAKNVIAVGNTENLRTELGPTSSNNIDDLVNSSSRGPAADGRVKPDICAPGNIITGGGAGTGGSTFGFIPGDPNHVYSGGTSHAAPQVAGAAALFTQYWRNSHAGVYPNPALIKAAIINTAQEMNGVNTSTAIPNGNEGWGRLNMKYMLNTGVPTLYVNQEIVYSNPGVGQFMIGTVADSTKPVRITLVWTDPPATADPALVNNLDLQVNVNGTFYRGNVFSGGVSVPGGSGDTINNVENIFLPAGIPAGTFFSVGVSSVALNGNGVLGNADATDQHFALVAYNFQQTVPGQRPPVDFDGDHKTDISIFRPTGGEWWYSRSLDNQTAALQFGTSTDRLVPADYTGDGKTDIAIWRPSNGQLYVLRSEDSSFYAFPFGISTDVFVPGDYDGDQKADAAVFRASAASWYIAKSGGGIDIVQFGISTDTPIPADYDGDNKTDIAIFRPSGGEWWINRSTGGVTALQFGASTDKLVPGDYTGDGKADIAFWRPSTGFWFVLRSENSSFYAVPFGTTGDLPVPGDYDGDGKFDTAVFRPSTATWYVDRTTAGILIRGFGLSTDTPLPNVFVR